MHTGDETNIRKYRPKNSEVCLKREERVITIGRVKKKNETNDWYQIKYFII